MSNQCYLCETCNKFKTAQCVKSDEVFCQKLFRIDSLYNNALLTETQKQKHMFVLLQDELDEIAFMKLKQFENNIITNVAQGKNIFIYSTTTGNGKTAWAVRLLQNYVMKSWYKVSCDSCIVLFVNIPRFLLELKANISEKSHYIEHIHKHVLKADLVVWDDIGTKGTTEFETENLLSLINARLDAGKSNIYTTNITPMNLKNVVGSRLASRITMAELIEFKDPDKRYISLQLKP